MTSKRVGQSALSPSSLSGRTGPVVGALMMAVLLSTGHPASALEVKDCRDAGVGIETIVRPVERAHATLYDGKVEVFVVDTVEPACCSSGVAVVLPARDDPVGGDACWAVTGLVSIDLAAATRTYDQAKGLLLTLPAKRNNPDGDPVEAPLKLRINVGQGRISLE